MNIPYVVPFSTQVVLSVRLLGFRFGGVGTRGDNLSGGVQHALKVVDRVLETLFDLDLGGPVQLSLGGRDIRLPLAGIILRFGQVNDLALGIGQSTNVLGKGLNGVFFGVPQVDGQVVVSIHQGVQTVNQISDVLEGTCLFSFSVDGQVLILQCLNDKVGYHTAIVRVHTWSKGIEDTRHTNFDLVLVAVTVHHSFGDTFSFIIARPGSNRIDVPPVAFGLRVDLGVAVDFGRGREQHTGADAFREAQHVEGTLGRRLDRLHRVVLVVRRGCWARQVVDLVHFEHDLFRHIVLNETEMMMHWGVRERLVVRSRY